MTGRRDEWVKLQEDVLELSRKVSGPEQDYTIQAMKDLAFAYCSDGRHEDGIALLTKACGMDPKDTVASLKLAVWQTWFGHKVEYEATRARLIQ